MPTPSSAPGSRSSVRGVTTATQTAVLDPRLEPWPSPGNGGTRTRGCPCGFPNGWTATWVPCPRETRRPRLHLSALRHPAEAPGTPPTQEGHRPAPTTMVAGGAPGSLPQGGPGTRRRRAPEARHSKEEPLPRDGAVPRCTRAPRTYATSTSSATSKAKKLPSPALTGTLSSSRSPRTAPRNSRATTHSPGRLWEISAWRPSESRGRRRCPKVGAIAGGCGRVQGPLPIFPRPACPGLFPQAPRRPCSIEGCGSQGKTPTRGSGDEWDPPRAVGLRPPRPCHWMVLSHALACPRGNRADPFRNHTLKRTRGARGNA